MKQFTEKLIQAGFKSLLNQKGDLGVSLALGGAEVSLAELVQSYGVLHRGGVLKELQVIRPRPPAPAQTRAPRVWTPESAEIITNIISSPKTRTLTFGRRGPVRFNCPVAMKTGTSNQFNNIWAVRFTFGPWNRESPPSPSSGTTAGIPAASKSADPRLYSR